MKSINASSSKLVISSVASQGTAGLASIVLTIAVARTQSAASLGVFAITLAVQGLLIGLIRSFTGDVFLFSRETYAPETSRKVLVGSTSATLILGVVVSFVSILGALGIHEFFPSELVESVMFGVALLLIPTSLQQHLRIALIAGRQHVPALRLDLLALVIVAIGAVSVSYRGASVVAYLIVWAVASGSYAAGASLMLRLKAEYRLGGDWLRDRWRGGVTFATDFAVTAGLAQFVLLFVSAVSGVAAAGAMKGAQTLITPLVLVMRGTGGPLATVLVRRVSAGAIQSAVRLCAAFSGLCLLSAGACSIWLLVPDPWLALLLGDSAVPARGLVVPTALALGATGIAMGAGHFLRANGELRVATLLKLVCFPVSLLAAVGGGWLWSAAGAQLGLMVGELTRSTLAWGAVRRRYQKAG